MMTGEDEVDATQTTFHFALRLLWEITPMRYTLSILGCTIHDDIPYALSVSDRAVFTAYLHRIGNYTALQTTAVWPENMFIW